MHEASVELDRASSGAGSGDETKHKLSVKERVVDELKWFLLIAFYLWIAFGILCICFYILEETLVGLWHGRVIVESLPPIAQGGAKGIVLGAIALSVQLIPLFALRELNRVVGGRELRALFFTCRSVPA